jgi:hypothetical protein
MGVLVFIKDGDQIEQNSMSRSTRESPGVVRLYYPYSRFNDILDMFEGNEKLLLNFDPNHPELGFIMTQKYAKK